MKGFNNYNELSDDIKRIVTAIYEELGMDKDNAAEDYDNDYLSINEGRDGQDYVWYADESLSRAVRISDGYRLTDDEIDNLLAD